VRPTPSKRERREKRRTKGRGTFRKKAKDSSQKRSASGSANPFEALLERRGPTLKGVRRLNLKKKDGPLREANQ